MNQVMEVDRNRGSVQLPRFTLLLGVVAIGLFLLFGSAPEALVFDRSAIAQGEVWRLITGHWVHSDLEHAAWDITAFLILGYLFVPARLQLFASLLVSMVIISMYIFLFMPELLFYCGLSGILNTMLVVGIYELWCQYRHPVIPLVAAATLVKILYESAVGKAIFTDTAWQSVPEVHLVGFAVGMIFVLIGIIIRFNGKILNVQKIEAH